MNKKLVFHITFHSQLEALKFHLDVITKWDCSKDVEYVITSAHPENLSRIQTYCDLNYPEYKFDFIFVSPDYGYHRGTLYNVTEGIRFINNNKVYDYIINVEADNMFYDEAKLLHIIYEMETYGKHMLIVDNVTKGNELYTNYPQHTHLSKYHSLTTLNVYSKYFINNHYPLEYYEEFMDFGWNGNPGTPFEDYLGLVFNKKHSLDTENKIKEYFKNLGYNLDYNLFWKQTLNHGSCYQGTYFNIEKQCYACCGEDLPPYAYFRDALTPDRFVKYGIVLFTKDLETTKNFIEYYKPFLSTYE